MSLGRHGHATGHLVYGVMTGLFLHGWGSKLDRDIARDDGVDEGAEYACGGMRLRRDAPAAGCACGVPRLRLRVKREENYTYDAKLPCPNGRPIVSVSSLGCW